VWCAKFDVYVVDVICGWGIRESNRSQTVIKALLYLISRNPMPENTMDEKQRNMLIQAIVMVGVFIATYIYATMGK